MTTIESMPVINWAAACTDRKDKEYIHEYAPLRCGTVNSTLTSLTLGVMFYKDIADGSMPYELATLRLGQSYNLPLTWRLPRTLISLTFGDSFNQPIAAGWLPDSLVYLIFGVAYAMEFVPGCLPPSLQYLVYRCGPERHNDLALQANSDIKHRIKQTTTPDTFPASIKLISFEMNKQSSSGTLPESVTEYVLDSETRLPRITKLTMSTYFNDPMPVECILPDTLVSLTFGDMFNQPLNAATLPLILRTLKFGFYYDQVLDINTLPSSLTSLYFGWRYNQVISPGMLPDSLIQLSFGNCFNQPLTAGVLPMNLCALELGGEFKHDGDNAVLPPSITKLSFKDLHNPKLIESLREVCPALDTVCITNCNAIFNSSQKLRINEPIKMFELMISSHNFADMHKDAIQAYRIVQHVAQNHRIVVLWEPNNMHKVVQFRALDNDHTIVVSSEVPKTGIMSTILMLRGPNSPKRVHHSKNKRNKNNNNCNIM
ncbi:hypothetical protein SAMD00019534_084550 [Acytostelium subglobosum LB1]|uniref:hypothetical protein n=1 Tax=Acytostelium subglobosum LB1 TaxID=1410327 RepID=UPI000644D162|nr:hypothetical protein SAMD00019534_084550 [Acytostelium subglobosum LB1]GAM25280.1 hypothetical protein SAMD00019534_084550 [Acytostelium subglobosum LB1]|eukprot:XP_012751800.1 hypothetical protein SAMD00019534_084550 [Acytostelium subglobosum LB1]